MITLQELCSYLDQLLQVSLFSDYCPNGLQIEGKNTIQKIVTGVSADLATIEMAIAQQADALIVHHGFFWKDENPVIKGVKKEKIKRLLDHGISLLAYHLPLDANREVGNNWKAASDMGWSNLEPFGTIGKNISIGVQGEVPTEALSTFIPKVEAYYGQTAHVASGGNKKIKRVALVSGGAHKMIKEAAEQKIDCFITGSFDEPIWSITEEEQIHFLALGHAATEKVGPKALGEHLATKFALDHQFINRYNPF